ncbi:hypothetical protein AAGS40_19770 [Paraburkholderia sp. PREW-6R]|uniref:hypothetical protein n=1 Tax=Paraburkholderia sp. PREW-6R TaxID=3141544 RepID=UPI0031F48F3F
MTSSDALCAVLSPGIASALFPPPSTLKLPTQLAVIYRTFAFFGEAHCRQVTIALDTRVATGSRKKLLSSGNHMDALSGVVELACRHSDVQPLLFNWLGIAATEKARQDIQIVDARFVFLPAVRLRATYHVAWSAEIGHVDEARHQADRSQYAMALAQFRRLPESERRLRSEPREPRETDYLLFQSRNGVHQGGYVTELLPAFSARSANTGEERFGWIRELIRTMPAAEAGSGRVSRESMEAKMLDGDEKISFVERPALDQMFRGLYEPVADMIQRQIQDQYLGATKYWKDLETENLDDVNCRFVAEHDLSVPFVLVDFTRHGQIRSCVFDGANPQRVAGRKPRRTLGEVYVNLTHKLWRGSSIVPSGGQRAALPPDAFASGQTDGASI